MSFPQFPHLFLSTSVCRDGTTVIGSSLPQNLYTVGTEVRKSHFYN